MFLFTNTDVYENIENKIAETNTHLTHLKECNNQQTETCQ